MELNQLPLTPPIRYPLVEGDPATFRLARFVIGTLAVMTIGSIAGIAAGNIAHYQYSSPSNKTNISLTDLYNISLFQPRTLTETSRLWLPLQERLKRANTWRKTRHTWLFMEKPANNRGW